MSRLLMEESQVACLHWQVKDICDYYVMLYIQGYLSFQMVSVNSLHMGVTFFTIDQPMNSFIHDVNARRNNHAFMGVTKTSCDVIILIAYNTRIPQK